MYNGNNIRNMKTSLLRNLTTGSLVEIISTIVVIVSMFMNWFYTMTPADIMNTEKFGDKLLYLTDSYGPLPSEMKTAFMITSIVFCVSLAACFANIIMKFFRRSRWLSLLLAFEVSLIVILFLLLQWMLVKAAGDMLSFQIGAGFLIALIGIIGLLIGVSLPDRPLFEDKK